MNRQNLKILIIGGGISGLCLAQGLKKSGINFEIYERSRDNNDWLEGYRININPVGSNALFRCLPGALWRAFLAGVGDAKEGLGFMTEQLKELVAVDDDMLTNYTSDPAKRQYAAGRKMLRYVLQAGLDEHIFYDKSFISYEQLPDGKVRAFFEDGTTATGDLLIGADGANSRVRTQLLPGAKRLTTDAVAIAGKTFLTDETRKWLPRVITSRMNVIMPLNKYFFFNAPFDHQLKIRMAASEIKAAAINAGIDPVRFFDGNENYILWTVIANKKEFKKGLDYTGQEIIDDALSKTKNWHPDLKKLIEAADVQSMSVFPLKVMKPLGNWPPGNVTIMGDAVHNMPPVYGLGANMALHDAVMLYTHLLKVINENHPLPAALYKFQETMLHDGFKALNKSLQYTNEASSNNFFQRQVSRLWFRLCNSVPALKRKSFAARWDEFIEFEV